MSFWGVPKFDGSGVCVIQSIASRRFKTKADGGCHPVEKTLGSRCTDAEDTVWLSTVPHLTW